MFSIRLTTGSEAHAISVSDFAENFHPVELTRVVTPVQAHGANVGIVTESNIDDQFESTDALITTLPGVAIGVRTADCVPILFHAQDIGAVAAVHAGWKGTVAGIVCKTIGRLVEMGASPEGLKVSFGPCICGDCYEVGHDIAELFRDLGMSDVIYKGPSPDPLILGDSLFVNERVDLVKANVNWFLRCGVRKENINFCRQCTRHCVTPGRCWPSWRRQPGLSDRLLTLIWMPKEDF